MKLDEDVIATSQYDPLPQIRNLIQDSNRLIGKLIASCCQPDRGEAMQALQQTLESMYKQEQIISSVELADKYIEEVNACGAHVGRLYVSCCTPTREKIYQKLLKNMNDVFIGCWEIKGHRCGRTIK